MKTDPGRKASAAEASKAYAEAAGILREIWNRNLPAAGDYVRANPPSPEGIARLAFLALELVTEPRAQRAARMRAAFAAEWHALTTKPPHNRAAVLANRFGWTATYARKIARELCLRK